MGAAYGRFLVTPWGCELACGGMLAAADAIAMTRTTTGISIATEQTFNVPDLDLPVTPVRALPIAPAPAPANESEPPVAEATLPALELDRSRSPVPTARFISLKEGDLAAASAGCPYCGAPSPAYPRACASCGYQGTSLPVSRFASVIPRSAAESVASSLAPPTRVDGFLDAMAAVPFGFWKRIPVYAVLAMLIGNGLKCGGLPTHTNVALVALFAVGLVGVIASLQRNP